MQSRFYPATPPSVFQHGAYAASPLQQKAHTGIAQPLASPAGDQFVIRFAGSPSDPQQIVSLAQTGDTLDRVSAKYLQQTLLYLPALQASNNISGQGSTAPQNILLSRNPGDLEFAAKRIAYALGKRGEFERLHACLQDPGFQQSSFRTAVISNLLRFDTARHNYELSRNARLPEAISDADSMAQRTVNRNFQSYIEHLHINPETLQGKRILLIGGGRSPIRQDLEKLGISATITNVDKFYPDKDPACEHTKLGCDFNSRAVDAHLAQNKYDEVWALFSLPAYAETISDVKGFYKRAMKALDKGGVLRILPATKELEESISEQPCEEYPAELWIALNDRQLLSRPQIYRKSEEILTTIRQDRQLSKLFSVSEDEDSEPYENLPYWLSHSLACIHRSQRTPRAGMDQLLNTLP